MSVKLDIVEALSFELGHGRYHDSILKDCLNVAKAAHLFNFFSDLDDAHIAFGETLKDKGILHIPYPSTMISNIQTDGHRRTVIARADDTGIGFYTIAHHKGGPLQLMSYGFFGFDGTLPVKLQIPGADPRKGACFPPGPQYNQAETSEWAGFGYIVIHAFCSCLLSKDAKQETVSPAHRLNAARGKKGLPPIEEYHVLRIASASHATNRDGPMGTTKSPRMHWRRGHIRQISEDRLVPVAPCIVGASESGFLAKDYVVKDGK